MKAIIPVAGESSRFWPLNTGHKCLFKIMGKPLIVYLLQALLRSEIDDVIIIQDKNRLVEQELKSHIVPGMKIKYLEQDGAKGMGDALLLAKNLLTKSFLVIFPEIADSEEIIRSIKQTVAKTKAKTILVGCKTNNPSLYGIMKLEKDRIVGIVEKPEKGKEPSDVKIVGAYVLEPQFFEFYDKVAHHQYDFEDALSAFVKKNSAEVVLLSKESLSLKYPWHIVDVKKYLMDKFLVAKIDPTVIIGKNTIIDGKVCIGRNAKIHEGAVIKGPCYIGENVIIGNNSLVRDYADLEKNSMVGALAEVSRSIFQENVHVHSGYFGDSVFCRDSKVGAGTITANVRIDRGEIKSTVKGEKKNTGKKSLGCFVGEGAKIGVNVSIMPGIFVGKNSLVGPSSLVSENVGDEISYFTKFEKIIKKLT